MVEDEISTLLVGIDGVCAGIIESIAENGSLPNLTALLDRSISAPLESQVPPTTTSSWTSLCTGVNPGTHGVFGDHAIQRNDSTANEIAELTIWELLSFNGKRSVVVNVPGSQRQRAFDGALVPGRGSPGALEWLPSTARSRYEREFGTYRISPDPETPPPKEYPRLVRTRADAFCFLADEYEPAFGAVVFDTPEAVLYQHPEDEALLRTVYTAIDEQLGRLLNRYDPSTVLIASDHGMTHSEFEFRVNEFLRREGFIESTAIRRPELHSRSGQQFVSMGGKPSLTSGVKRLVKTGRLGERVLGAFPYLTSNGPSVDYETSVAYMRSWNEPGIRVNEKRRDGSGVVSSDDYEFVRRDVIESLSELQTPAGEPMFEDVARREKYFWGSNAAEAADIVAVPADLNWSFSTALGGDVFAEPDRPWCPTFEGFFAIAGETVDTTANVSDAHLFDIAPTVLASLEVPVSDRMDGDALPGIPATRRQSYPLPN